MNIGKKIRELRIARLMSQEQLAEKVGVLQNTISRWERNEHRPTNDNEIKMAKALNVFIYEFYRVD